MSTSQPVDPRVRLAISGWPDGAPRGAVTAICAEHGITRKMFYALRARAVAEGPAAVLEPKSRRPHISPNRITDVVKARAVQVRASLEQSGLDHGPISVNAKTTSVRLDAPSAATLVRVFRDVGVAPAEPRKKPTGGGTRSGAAPTGE